MIRRFAIAEKSMTPLLQEGDYVVTRRRPPLLGDIVVFEHPHRPGFHLVKRVIGTRGDTVEIKEGKVFLNGRQLSEPWTTDYTTPDGKWHVPDHHVFVLGDARGRSTDDGRTIGPLPFGESADVVVFRYWPPAGFGRVRTPGPTADLQWTRRER